MNKIKDHWIAITKEYFPKDADLILQPVDDFCLVVQWKLKTDPNRPNKMSKRLRLIIPEETIDDYKDTNSDNRQNFDRKLKKFIEKIMANFEPDHDTPYGGTTPTVTKHVRFGITY